MKRKYKSFKRQRIMDYESWCQSEGESSNASQNGSNNLFFSPPTDTYDTIEVPDWIVRRYCIENGINYQTFRFVNSILLSEHYKRGLEMQCQ